MLGKAEALGCKTSDYACLCKNMDFGFGVRDCSTPVCHAAGVDPAPIISAGMDFCARSLNPLSNSLVVTDRLSQKSQLLAVSSALPQ